MRKTKIYALLTILLLVAIGCGNESKDTTFLTDISHQNADLDPSDKSFVNSLDLDSLDYEESSGTLDPDTGAILELVMHTWPENSRFLIVIPPTALPEDLPATDFSIKVPTYESYMEHEGDNMPLIVRLEPSNINFVTDVMVYVTYMPWVWVPSNPEFSYGFVPDYTYYGDAIVANQTKTKVELIMSVPHFSDWVALPGGGNGDGNDDDGPGK